MDRFDDPLKKYELLLFNLARIYSTRKLTSRTDWTLYSDLLIEKFAIQSSTLYHLIYGFIESKDSTPDQRKFGFDVFTINSLLRVLIETYITFNHIFIYPTSQSEKEFRFLLWELDSLISKQKFKIEKSDFDLAESIIENDRKKIDNLFNDIPNHPFVDIIGRKQLISILDSKKKKARWRFTIEEGIIIQLKIIDLVELCCPKRAFSNIYKYASMHTHSGFVSIDQFQQIRGKIIPNDYVDSYLDIAIILTMFIIKDICTIDRNALKEFERFPKQDIFEINGIDKTFR
jgi:hypothetical protein